MNESADVVTQKRLVDARCCWCIYNIW